MSEPIEDVEPGYYAEQALQAIQASAESTSTRVTNHQVTKAHVLAQLEIAAALWAVVDELTERRR